MRDEKQIRDRLTIALKDLRYLKEEYNREYKDKHIENIVSAMTAVDAEIKTLKWILGEYID